MGINRNFSISIQSSMNLKLQKNNFYLRLSSISLIESLFSRFFIDGAHTLESISVCTNWFNDKTGTNSHLKVLIFNLTGDREPTVFFTNLSKCDFDIVIFTPNVGNENDRAGNYLLSSYLLGLLGVWLRIRKYFMESWKVLNFSHDWCFLG